MEKIMLEISKGAVVVGCGGFLRELKKILPEIETLEVGVDLETLGGVIILDFNKTYVIDRFFRDKVVKPKFGTKVWYVNNHELVNFTKKYFNLYSKPTPPNNVKTYGSKDDGYLFEIKMKDINSVPQVFYKGGKIEALVDLDLEWKTIDSDSKGESEFHLSFLADGDKIGYNHSKI